MSRRYKSSASKRPFSRYSYDSLGKIDEDTEEYVSFYGIIIDACFPYKLDDGKYMCHLKVVDPTLNIKGKQENFATVIMVGRRFEDLPICQRVGDAIRCHRAEYTNREGQIYLKLNLMYNSSWAMFTADKEIAPEVEDQEADYTYTPYAWSGYSYTFENVDRKSLDALRTWNKKYFAENPVIIQEMYTPLDEAEQEEGDFNVLGKVTQVVQRDDFMNDIRIKDQSGSTWFATISRRKFPRVVEGEVVKVRSALVEEDSDREHSIRLSPHSNIMTVVPFSQLRKQLRSAVKSSPTEVDEALLAGEVIHEPVLASTVSKAFKDAQVTPLHELFSNPDEDTDLYRARFQVVAATSGKDTVVIPKGKQSKRKVGEHFAQ
jgi:hypothetical protein